MIRLRNVTKFFGRVNAVNDVTFEVLTGQCVGLLGPNGAGKTTTLRMITGFMPPSTGSVSVGGHDSIEESILARRLIGYLPEATPVYPEMRVVDFLAYRAGLYGLGRAERRRALGRALDLCRVAEASGRRIGQLSKGYRQRVGLAAALVHNPPVLVLDEPTSGLDPSQIQETRSLIRDLALKRTVIVSSHILPEIEKTCDRVIIIARGSVRADGSPAELVRAAGERGKYVLEAECPGSNAQGLGQALRACPGVEAVSAKLVEPGWTRFEIIGARGGPDLRELIGRQASSKDVGVRELTRVVPTLEHVFMRVIDAEEPADGARPPVRVEPEQVLAA